MKDPKKKAGVRFEVGNTLIVAPLTIPYPLSPYSVKAQLQQEWYCDQRHQYL